MAQQIRTPEQYNCYMERLNAEFKAQQRRIYEQNLLRMELNHIETMENIVEEFEEQRINKRQTKPQESLSARDRLELRRQALMEEIDTILKY